MIQDRRSKKNRIYQVLGGSSPDSELDGSLTIQPLSLEIPVNTID